MTIKQSSITIKKGRQIAEELNTVHRKRSHSTSFAEIDYLMDKIKKLENKNYNEIDKAKRYVWVVTRGVYYDAIFDSLEKAKKHRNVKDLDSYINKERVR